MALNPQQTGKLIEKLVLAKVKVPLCLEGGRGIGKSGIVKQTASKLDWHCIDIRLALDTPEDVAGYPRPCDNHVIYLINDWVNEATNMSKKKKGVILFFDEINRAPIQVRQALFEIMTEYSVRRYKLPENSYIIFAMNPDNGEYQVEQLDIAFQRRMIRITVEPDIDAWLKWAANEGKIDEEIILFIRSNPQYLFSKEKCEIKAEYNPDAWRMVNDITKADLSGTELVNVLTGLVGKEATALYIKFLREKEHPLTAEEFFKLSNEELVEYVKKIESSGIVTTIVDNITNYTNDLYGEISESEENEKNKEDKKDGEKESKTKLTENDVYKIVLFCSNIPAEHSVGLLDKLNDNVFNHIKSIKSKEFIKLLKETSIKISSSNKLKSSQ